MNIGTFLYHPICSNLIFIILPTLSKFIFLFFLIVKSFWVVYFNWLKLFILWEIFFLLKNKYISLKLFIFVPWIMLILDLAGSIGFCPPWFTSEPPINAIFEISKNFLVSPYVSTKYISVLGLIFCLDVKRNLIP